MHLLAITGAYYKSLHASCEALFFGLHLFITKLIFWFRICFITIWWFFELCFLRRVLGERFFNCSFSVQFCRFGSFWPTFQFLLGCTDDWNVGYLLWFTTWREKWREYLLFAFLVGFSFLFGARGAYSSGWEPNFNARFFLKEKQLEQVMPLLSMAARSSAVKHWL